MSDSKTVRLGDQISVRDLAEQLEEKATVVIATLMKNGVMATINDELDRDTAEIIAAELGAEVQPEEKPEATISKPKRELSKSAKLRPPVVAVMGHVDHGKTSLLDAIRGTETAAGEAGGITQHISAYHISYKKRDLTFLDTPGHEAFASLREHGAALTDVAIIVVAADDGVKPQTKEAINYAKKAGVHTLVAINKIDKQGVDVNRVKKELSEEGLVSEDWGGDTVMVEVSAKDKTGIDNLLDMVLLVADVNELKADLDVPAEGIVIESHMAVGKGPVATLLIEHGELEVGQFLVAGSTYAKVRDLEDEDGKFTKSAGPSRAVKVSGFKAVPSFGDRFIVVPNEKEARTESQSHAVGASRPRVTKSITTAEQMLANIDASTQQKTLNVVLKADVRGSLESLIKSLEQLGNDEVSVRVLSSGVGSISESDITLAHSSKAIVVGFNVTVSSLVKRTAARDQVPLTIHSVIYELLDDVKERLEQLLSPEVVETELGKLRLKAVFRTTKELIICGGEVIEGKAVPSVLVRIMRGEQHLGEAQVASVQRGQQVSKEVVKGELCGVELKTKGKILLNEGDILEFFERSERQKKL